MRNCNVWVYALIINVFMGCMFSAYRDTNLTHGPFKYRATLKILSTGPLKMWSNTWAPMGAGRCTQRNKSHKNTAKCWTTTNKNETRQEQMKELPSEIGSCLCCISHCVHALPWCDDCFGVRRDERIHAGADPDRAAWAAGSRKGHLLTWQRLNSPADV